MSTLHERGIWADALRPRTESLGHRASHFVTGTALALWLANYFVVPLTLMHAHRYGEFDYGEFDVHTAEAERELSQ